MRPRQRVGSNKAAADAVTSLTVRRYSASKWFPSIQLGSCRRSVCLDSLLQRRFVADMARNPFDDDVQIADIGGDHVARLSRQVAACQKMER